jgi:hypothetical protein
VARESADLRICESGASAVWGGFQQQNFLTRSREEREAAKNAKEKTFLDFRALA